MYYHYQSRNWLRYRYELFFSQKFPREAGGQGYFSSVVPPRWVQGLKPMGVELWLLAVLCQWVVSSG